MEPNALVALDSARCPRPLAFARRPQGLTFVAGPGAVARRVAVTGLWLLLLALACLWAGHPASAAGEIVPIRRVGGLEVRVLGKKFRPDPQRTLARQTAFDRGGNTSARNTGTDHLDWKASGYFQRNRDLGQVFTADRNCRLEAIVLRTGPDTAAVLAGAPGAKVFVQFFEVTGTPRLHDNGTPPGKAALHGFSTNHRCDDYLVGVEYRPVLVVTGGVFPDLPPTRDWDGKTNGTAAGCLVYLRWDLKGEARLPLEAGQRYAFMVGFEEPGRERGFTLANANAAGVSAPPSLTDAHDRYHGGWALRREGDGTLPPTMNPGEKPPADPAALTRLQRESLFADGPARFALAPTTDGFPDVDTYRDFEFYLECGAEAPAAAAATDPPAAAVMNIPGCVAFWDFVKREPGGARRFLAHTPPGAENDFPLEAANYVREYWGQGREATYADFPLLGRGPFGNAIRIVKETDPNFRPFLFVPRARLQDSPLDIKGPGKSVSVVVWAIRESGNHALAGIWHEGTDLKQPTTANIRRVDRGQRQYALFAGLNVEGSACGHVSENGAGSFRNRYALHKCNSAARSPTVAADSPAERLDAAWHCFAMTFDNDKDELTAWLDGVAGDRWLENPKHDQLISSAYHAYLQGHYARTPVQEPDEEAAFPKDQYYNPPEERLIAHKVLAETGATRTELREYRYTKIVVTLRRDAGGNWRETARDLVALRLNPWWFPHDIYTPANDGSGGPFTIGRVIHSSRGVGFTGWIGGVAVYHRALTPEELKRLADLRVFKPSP